MSGKILTILGIGFLCLVIIIFLFLTQSITYNVKDYAFKDSLLEENKIMNKFESNYESFNNIEIDNIDSPVNLKTPLSLKNADTYVKNINTDNDSILSEEFISDDTSSKQEELEIKNSDDFDRYIVNDPIDSGKGSNINPPIMSTVSGSILGVEEFEELGEKYIKVKYQMNIPQGYNKNIDLTLYDINGEKIEKKDIHNSGIDEAVFPGIPGTIRLAAGLDIMDSYDYNLSIPSAKGKIVSIDYILGGTSSVNYSFNGGGDQFGRLNLKAINEEGDLIFTKNLVENDNVLITYNKPYTVYLYYGDMLLDSCYFDGGEAANIFGEITGVEEDAKGKTYVNYMLNASEKEARTASIEVYSSDNQKIYTVNSLNSGKGIAETIKYYDDVTIRLMYANQILDSYDYQYTAQPKANIDRIDRIDIDTIDIYYTFDGSKEEADDTYLNYHTNHIDTSILPKLEVGSHVVRYVMPHYGKASIQIIYKGNILCEKFIVSKLIDEDMISSIVSEGGSITDISYYLKTHLNITGDISLNYDIVSEDKVLLTALKN